MKENGYPVACYHAETHALYKVPKEKRSKATIYVTRIRKNGKYGLSKPCEHCVRSLLTEGVKRSRIWYTDDEGTWHNLTGQSKEI